MLDTHYDLLSIAYTSYLNGDYSYLNQISKYFNDNNVKAVFANLYFMSREEMNNELHPRYYQDNVSVYEMFSIAKEILQYALPNTDIIYSIEGADYITGPEELEDLYNAGLDALILCHNAESKYGSGNKSDKGLTGLGRELIEKAIDLGLGIDLSHANMSTFNDLIGLVKEKKKSGKDVCVYASHSNARSLCDRDRNLTDQQLRAIKEIDGLVGIFSNKNFVVKPSEQTADTNYRDKYLEHIEHAAKFVGYDNIMCSTDDMNFCAWADPEYGELAIYDYSNIASKLRNDLIAKFKNEEVAENMIYVNGKEKIINKLRENREKKRGKNL